MNSRAEEIARVAAELTALVEALAANVDALSAIIAPDGKEAAR